VNHSHNSADSEAELVLHSYIQELSSKENFSNKGGEGEIGVPHTIMQHPLLSKCMVCSWTGTSGVSDDDFGEVCPICGNPIESVQESPRSKCDPNFLFDEASACFHRISELADEACLGPVAVNSPRLDMADRCGPCTADCYENCGVWMPSGSEIREVWGERQRDMRRLD
jgi:hypothetical protein